jgi:hypothetical protein
LGPDYNIGISCFYVQHRLNNNNNNNVLKVKMFAPRPTRFNCQKVQKRRRRREKKLHRKLISQKKGSFVRFFEQSTGKSFINHIPMFMTLRRDVIFEKKARPFQG